MECFPLLLAGIKSSLNTLCIAILHRAIYYDGDSDVWDWYLLFQWTEMLASCLSVRLMKRHLMVWAIFAPRFMFAAVFSVVALVLGIANVLVVERIASSAANTKAHSLHI
jgi:hypothetical protein